MNSLLAAIRRSQPDSAALESATASDLVQENQLGQSVLRFATGTGRLAFLPTKFDQADHQLISAALNIIVAQEQSNPVNNAQARQRIAEEANTWLQSIRPK